MAPFAPTLGGLKEMLREGWIPEDSPYATKIGSGAWRVAYRVGPFILKRKDGYAGGDGKPSGKAGAGIRWAPTVSVRGWEIQVAYTPLYTSGDWQTSNWWDRNVRTLLTTYHDDHAGNIGIDRRGTFVQFDW